MSIGADTYLITRDRHAAAAFTGTELRATLHVVSTGTLSALLLSTDRSPHLPILRATLPVKPTGAVEIVPQYSLDGETNWVSMGNVLEGTPLEWSPPRHESYTAGILTSNDTPLTEYVAGGISGFYIRLSITGGAFSGVTECAAWPAHYEYNPPRDDSDDDGGTGNRANAGFANAGGSAGSGGQRPGLPEHMPLPIPGVLSMPQVPIMPPPQPMEVGLPEAVLEEPSEGLAVPSHPESLAVTVPAERQSPAVQPRTPEKASAADSTLPVVAVALLLGGGAAVVAGGAGGFGKLLKRLTNRLRR